MRLLPRTYQRRKMAAEDISLFRNTFHGGNFPNTTILAIEVKNASGIITYSDKFYNADNKHAEIHFLEAISQREEFNGPCEKPLFKITCYINYTPRYDCAAKLIQQIDEWKGTVHLEIICVGFCFVHHRSRELAGFLRIREDYWDVKGVKQNHDDQNFAGLQNLA